MPNLRMLIKNIADTAVITATPAAVATLPVTNLQTQQRKQTFRTTSLASQNIDFTWTANQTCNMVALPRFNGTTAATARIYRYSDSAWTTLIDDTTALAAYSTTGLDQLDIDEFQNADFLVVKNYVKYLSAITNMKSMRITLLDAANAAGYLEASRAMVGTYKQFSDNPDHGSLQSSIQDLSTFERADSGSALVNKMEKFFKTSISPEWIPEATDLQWLRAAARYLGLDKDFWVSFYPEAGGVLEYYNQGQVRFASVASFEPNSYAYQKSSFQIEGA